MTSDVHPSIGGEKDRAGPVDPDRGPETVSWAYCPVTWMPTCGLTEVSFISNWRIFSGPPAPLDRHLHVPDIIMVNLPVVADLRLLVHLRLVQRMTTRMYSPDLSSGGRFVRGIGSEGPPPTGRP